MKVIAILALAVGCSACYRYVPTQLEATPAGQGVRVLVTRVGAAELATVTDVDPGVPLVRGTVVGVEGSNLLLQVPIGRRQEGFISAALNQTVRVPTGEIISFERRELDRAATGLVVAGAVGLVAAVVAFIVKPFGRDEMEDPDLPDELLLERGRFSIPVGSIPIGD